MKKSAIFILLLSSTIYSQGITNTLGGDSSSDKFILKNSSGTDILVATGNGKVGVGISNPIQTLHVSGPMKLEGELHANSIETTSGIHSFSGSSYPAIWGEATASSGATKAGNFSSISPDGYGVYCTAPKYPLYSRATASSGFHYGGFFETENPSGRGIYATNTTSSGTAYGGVFEAKNSNDGVGVWADGKKYDFYAAGTGTDYGAASSIRWKKNIVEIDKPLEKISQLRGVYFDWDEEHGGTHDIGCIAEEIGKVLPEIVVYEENGIDAEGMDYSKLTPLLIEAIKALEKRVAELEETQ